jgi:PBSX family phage terminase large subunit
MLKSRLRCEHSIFDGTANPESPQHFIKSFIDSDADIYCQTSTIYDNPFLPKQFVAELEKEYAGTVYYKRYIMGEWAAATGLIYPMYEEALLTPDFRDLRDVFTEYALSIDYGTQNAFAAILWGKYDGVWYAFDEYYYSGRDTGVQKTDEEYGEDIDEFTDQVRNKLRTGEKLTTIIDPSAASFIALLRKRNGYKVRKADNAVEDGIRETATSMKTGKIKFYPCCKNWKKEAASYAWDENETKDKPIKVDDHLQDAVRYFVKTMRIAKPRREL